MIEVGVVTGFGSSSQAGMLLVALAEERGAKHINHDQSKYK